MSNDFVAPTIPIQRHMFFADESGITTSRYQLVGGTAVTQRSIVPLYRAVWEVRQAHSMHAEFKWSKVSNQKFEAYKDLVDRYFDFLDRGAITFMASTFDNHMWQHARWNKGDPDIGLSKNYYQLILHQFINRYGDDGWAYVCLDRRLSSTPLIDLKSMLNKGAAKNYGMSFDPIIILEARDSRKEDILQINDVILGAVSSTKNDRHLEEGARKAKVDLARHVLKRSGLASYDRNSPKSVPNFSIWNRTPRR